jgi:hypothetical protein
MHQKRGPDNLVITGAVMNHFAIEPDESLVELELPQPEANAAVEGPPFAGNARADMGHLPAWEGELRPFESRELAEEEPFPLYAFPEPLRSFSSDLAHRVQAAPALVATSTICACAAAVQAHVDVTAPHGARYPATEFGLALVGTGGRKSTIVSNVFKPLLDRQADAHARMSDTFSADCVATVSDVTPDAVVELMHRVGLHSMLAVSAEAGQVVSGFAWDRKNKLRTGAILSAAFDGAPLDRARVSGAVTVRVPRLSIMWATQPIAGEPVLADVAFQNQGIASRFLVCFPQVRPGGRFLTQDYQPGEPESQAAFYAAMHRILGTPFPRDAHGQLAPRALEMSSGGRARWIREHNVLEGAAWEEFQTIQALALRAPEHIARIACILTAFTDPDASTITEESIDAASVLVQWYLGEALRIATTYLAAPAGDDPQRLWNWLLQKGERYVPLRRIQQYGPTELRAGEKARAALETLESLHRVRRAPSTRAHVWEVRLAY